MRKNVNKIMSTIVLFMILAQNIIANTAEEEREKLSKYFQIQEEKYKKYFDKELLLEELDYDVDKIINFVNNGIVFQAYEGILRGVDGTLMGRAGNAHDQAITLASMLNDADIEAQIMVGRLSIAQAEELNQNIAMATFPKLAKTDTSNQPKIIQKMNLEKNKQATKVTKKNLDLAQTIYQTISKQVQREGEKTLKKSLLQSSMSYRWVRYKDTVNNKWIEVHPAYNKAKIWKLKETNIEAGSINQHDLQNLSIEIWIENTDGKKYSITGKWSVPSANLIGKTLSIEIMSDVMLKMSNKKNIEKELEKSHYFFAKINDTLPKEGKVFDLKGNIYPGDTIEGLNTVFAEVGKKLDNVTSLFNDSLNFNNNTKKDATTLKKVWIEFTLSKPNHTDEIIHRILFQQTMLKKPEEVALTLLQGWDISVNTTKSMSHVYQRNSSKQLLDEVQFINNIKKYIVKNKAENILDAASSFVPKRSLIPLSNIRNKFDTLHVNDTISYPNEIHLLALRKGFLFSNNTYGLYQTMDILSNKRWSFMKHQGKIIPSLLTSIKHGVWETEVETYKVVVEDGITSLDSSFSVLALNNDVPVETKPFNPHTLRHNEKAWWQVDVNTGSTKGMIKLDQGYAGGASTEYSEILSLITGKISEYFFVKGTSECINAGGSAKCCVAINGALWAAGIGGGAVGAANKGVQSLGKEGAAIYMGIASVEFDVGTSYLPVTDICK